MWRTANRHHVTPQPHFYSNEKTKSGYAGHAPVLSFALVWLRDVDAGEGNGTSLDFRRMRENLAGGTRQHDLRL
jgi:hypothetical protein